MKNDYIMRMIEEFFRALARVISNRQINNYPEAREGLDNLSKMITRLSVEQLKAVGAEGIKQFFSLEKPEDTEKVFCIAKIIKEDALIYEGEGNNEEAKKSYQSSLEFFELIKDINIEEHNEILEEINYITNKIQS